VGKDRGSPFDTIWAPASPKGVAPRGIVRLSGPESFPILERLCGAPFSRRRGGEFRNLILEEGGTPLLLPALCLGFVGPASYTGEDLCEIHCASSPPLLAILGRRLEECGARGAWPGEFTRRAFQNGRLDLARAEAVIAWIRARDEESLARAGRGLGGGGSPEEELRRSLLDLWALLEAGLDFSEGETGEVSRDFWEPELRRLERRAARMAPELPVGGGECGLPSYLLLGPPNAGKTSLCNALCLDGTEGRGLVSSTEGTTRDIRWRRVAGLEFRLADSAGGRFREVGEGGDQERRILERELARADGWIWMESPGPGGRLEGPPRALPGTPALKILGKADLRGAGTEGRRPPGWLPVSVRSGEGLEDLRESLRALGSQSDWTAALEAARRAGLDTMRSALARAVAALDRGLGPECVAAELREAAGILDPERSSRLPEELLDRIFAAFCLGK